MKTLSLTIVFLLFLLVLSSCSKEHTCTCNYDDFGVEQTEIHIFDKSISKSDAETACAAYEDAYAIFSINGANCNLD